MFLVFKALLKHKNTFKFNNLKMKGQKLYKGVHPIGAARNRSADIIKCSHTMPDNALQIGINEITEAKKVASLKGQM